MKLTQRARPHGEYFGIVWVERCGMLEYGQRVAGPTQSPESRSKGRQATAIHDTDRLDCSEAFESSPWIQLYMKVIGGL
jgi:hypothetical protein